MDLHTWLIISSLLLVAVKAEPPVQTPEPHQSTQTQQNPMQRYKEVIMYLTPSQIKALESGEGYIVPHPTTQPSQTTTYHQQQKHVYQEVLQEQHYQPQEHQQQQQELQLNQLHQQQQHEQQEIQLHQQQQELQLHQQQQQQQQLQKQQFQLQQDETNRKQRLQLQEAIQNQPTSLIEQNTYEQHINQQNSEQWNAQSYPQIQPQSQPHQLKPNTQKDHYLQFGKSQSLPDNYAYMYFYPRGKSHVNENIQPNPHYSEQIKLLHLEPSQNQNLQIIEAPVNSFHHTLFDQQKHKQLINYLVPDKFQLIPYDYGREQTFNDLLAQQHLDSQHLRAHQDIQQQVHIEAQQQDQQEVQKQLQLQHQLTAPHQIELETQHLVQNQIQIDAQHQTEEEVQHQIQHTQHQIQQTQQHIHHKIQLQAQKLSQLEPLQHDPFKTQLDAHHQDKLQIKQQQLEVQTLLPQEIDLKDLEDHIKQHIKSQEFHRQLEQQAKIQEIENKKRKEIEIANMDAHHESQQIKAEQVKVEEMIKSGQIRAQKIESQIAAENLEAFAKLENSHPSIGKKENEQALFSPLNPRNEIIDTLNQYKPKLESGFIPIASNTQDNSNKILPKEVAKILLKNEIEKQKALAKAAVIAKEPPRVIKEEIKVVKRPQEVRVKEVHVPTPVFVPYPKPIEVKMPEPFIVPVEVLRPVPVPIVRTEKVEVEKPVPIEVQKVVHIPVTKNVYVPVDKPYVVEKLVPVEVEKKIPVHIHINKPQKYTIIRHVWKH